MHEPAILDSPAELSAEWLTAALRDAGVLGTGAVCGFEAEPLGEGVGVLGQLVRLRLDYDGDAAEAPHTLIAKFPATAAENRFVGHSMGHYAGELDFYERVASAVTLRVPRAYYTALDRQAGRFTLLIEDMAPAESGDQVLGSTREQITIAMEALSGHHANWWGRVDTPDFAWMRSFDSPELAGTVQAAYQMSWEPCVANFGDDFTASSQAAGKRLGEQIPQVMAKLAQAPRTLVHGDFRLDNLVFGEIAGGAPVAVLDWQISNRGRGPYDVGYHMSQSVEPALRGEMEEGVMREYHRRLVDAGVQGYDFDQAWEDYRRAVLFCMAYPVIVLGGMDTANARGVALGRALLTRCVAAMDALDASALLDA